MAKQKLAPQINLGEETFLNFNLKKTETYNSTLLKSQTIISP
jgi:hypothetical protein